MPDGTTYLDDQGNPIPAGQSQPNQSQPSPAIVSATSPAAASTNTAPTYLDDQGNPIQAASQSQGEGILSSIKKAISGPTTAAGSPLNPDAQKELSGVSDIFHGNIKQGASKIFAAETPHIRAGSMVERAMQAIDPSFKGTPVEEFNNLQDQTINKPLIDTGQFIDKNQHPVLKALAEASSSMTGPQNVSIMIATGGLGLVDSPEALATANKLLSAGFSAQTIGDAYKHLRGFAQAYEKGDSNDALYQLTHAVVSGTMSSIAAAHAAGVEVPIASETDKNVARAVAGKVSDVAGKASDVVGAVSNAAANTKQSLIKSAGFGQDFNDLVEKISPPSKTKVPGYSEKVVSASPFLRDILNKNPDISTPEEFYNAISDRQKAVDAELLNRASSLKGTAQAQMPGIVERTMSHLDDYFESQGAKYKPEEIEKAKQEVRDFMEQEGALKDPDLFNVEKIRQRFNDDTQPIFNQAAGTVPAAVNAAKYQAANFLRPEIDAKYDQAGGVSGVQEWRKMESNLIAVKDQLKLGQQKAEQMGEFSVLKSIIKNSGWPTVLAALGKGPAGLVMEAGRIGADYLTDYNKNPNTLIRRAKAAAGPGGQPGTPEFGQVPRAALALPPAPVQTPIRTEPIEPVTAAPAVDPETRAIRLGLLLPEAQVPLNISGVRTEPIEPPNPENITRPGVQPKAENRQLPSAGETSGPNTTEPSTTGVRLHTPSLNMPESSLTLPKDMPAELKPIAEEAKEAADKNGVQFRGIQEGSGNHPGVAIFEHPKYGSVGVKLDNFSPEQLQTQIADLEQRNAPKSEELESPENRFKGISPESLRAHELGHAVVGKALGLVPESILSHQHPELANGRVAMSTRFDFANIGAKPNGDIPTSALIDHMSDLLTTYLAGGVAQELIDRTPFEENPHTFGDLNQARGLLRDLKIPEDRIEQHIDNAANRARSILNQGDTIQKIKGAASIREPGTHEHYQISPDRLEKVLNNIGGKPNERINPKSDKGSQEHGQDDDAGRESQDKGGIGEKINQSSKINSETAPSTISTRDIENPTHEEKVGLDEVLANPKLSERMADVVKKTNGVRITPEEAKTPESTLRSFIRQMKGNIKWLYNQSSPEEQIANRKWYDGAHDLTKDLADKHGIKHEQAAAVTAALSPNNDWDLNVSQAKRLIDTYKSKQDFTFTPEMLEAGEKIRAKNTGNKELLDALDNRIQGKKLSELTNPVDKAAWIRLYDEAHNTTEYEKIGPDGKLQGLVRKKNGEPAKSGWGYLGPAVNAVQILEDGSRDNISNSLGSQHKVRSFYNNIIDPNSERGDVTVDTHAIAGAHLAPFSGKSPEVLANFKGVKSKSSGIAGTYPLYAEAYRQAAKELDIPNPRELQSFTWDKIRKVFPSQFKTEANKTAVNDIWKEYTDGKIGINEVRNRIAKTAGPDSGLAQGKRVSGNTGELRHTEPVRSQQQSQKSGTGRVSGKDILGGALPEGRKPGNKLEFNAETKE
jgi:hypothetical protein